MQHLSEFEREALHMLSWCVPKPYSNDSTGNTCTCPQDGTFCASLSQQITYTPLLGASLHCRPLAPLWSARLHQHRVSRKRP